MTMEWAGLAPARTLSLGNPPDAESTTMHRIDGPGATSGNLFTEGDPTTGVPATTVTGAWLNAIQEEIANVIEAAGLTLAKPDNTQLAAAIAALITAGSSAPDLATTSLAGIVELATVAETAEGILAARAVTPVGLAGVLVGMVAPFAMATPPPGWLACSGQAVLRADYPALFAAIGTTYGAGDGSTTFGLPDLRGEFVRGVDGGRGVDVGRSLGSAQAQSLPNHKHELPYATISASAIAMGGSGSTPAKPWGVGSTFTTYQSNGATDAHVQSANYDLTNTPYGPSINGDVLPRNVALLYCIKH